MNDVGDLMKFGVGQPVRRFEDPRLLPGKGPYQDDVTLPGRPGASSCARRMPTPGSAAIDTRAASGGAGRGRGLYRRRITRPTASACPRRRMPRKKADGSPMFAPQRPALVIDRVRYVGDPVAMVIAETLDQAKDAAELIEVDYEPLPAVTDRSPRRRGRTRRASGTRTPTTSRTSTSAATRRRPRRRSPAPRTSYAGATSSPASMRNTWSRAARSAPTIRGEDRYTLYADVNYPHRVRNMLANQVFKVPESKVRVIVPRCRRRLRRQGLAVCRAPAGAVGGAQARPPGEVDAASARRCCSPTSMRRDNIGEIELAFDARRTRSSACASTCWPISAPISPPTGSC